MVAGLFAPKPSSANQLGPAAGLLVADSANLKGGGAGVMQPAARAWVYDSGAFHQFWPGLPAAPSLTVTQAQGGDWRRQGLAWTAPGCTSVSLVYVVGNVETVIYTGTVTNGGGYFGWFDAGIAPSSSVTYKLYGLNAAGSSFSTQVVATPAVPAPASFAKGTTSYSTASLSWGAVYGASTYQVVNLLTNAVMLTTTGTSGNVTTAASTAYKLAVRAVVTPVVGSPVTGPYSNSVSYTSPAAPASGPANGVYVIEPASNCTYQWGESGGQSAGWRAPSDGLFHGDGGSVSSRGQQAAFLFFANRFPAAFPSGLGSKTVTKVEIYMKRLSTGGTSSAQTCHWMLHQHSSKPAGAPSLYSSTDAGALAWGQGAWITLPVAWGPNLISGYYRGLAWGKVASRYMLADESLALGTPNGTIRITIGS